MASKGGPVIYFCVCMKKEKPVPSGNKMNEPVFCTPILDYISQDVMLDETTKILVAENCRLVKFPKGKHLLEMVCKYAYFMVEGECISYFTLIIYDAQPLKLSAYPFHWWRGG